VASVRVGCRVCDERRWRVEALVSAQTVEGRRESAKM